MIIDKIKFKELLVNAADNKIIDWTTFIEIEAQYDLRKIPAFGGFIHANEEVLS